MATFVLVHGAWGGSYAFRHVRKNLHRAGHDAFTPSLTGIGERSHLTGPRIDLELHITDVLNVVRYEDLTDIVLVGFSYGGMVVTGALERLGTRVRSLVYLDAFVPAPGESIADLVGMSIPHDDIEAPWSVPPRPRQLDTAEATAWSEARRVDQPIRTFTQPVSMRVLLEEHRIPLTYIKATADPDEEPDSAFWKAANHASHSPRWGYHEIATNHMIPLTRPDELTEILLDLA